MNLIGNDNILEGIGLVGTEIIEEGEITENQVQTVKNVLQKGDKKAKQRHEQKDSMSVAGFMSAEKI